MWITENSGPQHLRMLPQLGLPVKGTPGVVEVHMALFIQAAVLSGAQLIEPVGLRINGISRQKIRVRFVDSHIARKTATPCQVLGRSRCPLNFTRSWRSPKSIYRLLSTFSSDLRRSPPAIRKLQNSQFRFFWRANRNSPARESIDFRPDQ